MSPSRIVSHAIERGLDLIAITDHNSALNSPALEESARRSGRISCLYGMEITSTEEVHSLALFGTSAEAVEFGKILSGYLPPVRFDSEIFGEQVVVDADENVLEIIDTYLVNGLTLAIDRIEAEVHKFGGLFIPAHIDRPINSMISQLGFFPDKLNCDAVEVSRHFHGNAEAVKLLNPESRFAVISGSDAHYPDDIGVVYSEFECDDMSFSSIANALHDKKIKIIHKE
jgi:PHP family Zn ribbon phosphoesterase